MEHRATAAEATHATQRGSAGESPLLRRAVPRDPLSELLQERTASEPGGQNPSAATTVEAAAAARRGSAGCTSSVSTAREPSSAGGEAPLHATPSPRIHLSNSSKNGLHLNPATETPPPPPPRRQRQRLRRTPQVAPPPSRKRGSQAPRAASPHSRAAPSLPRLTISLPRPMRCW
ncbi:hypothetical protein GQ55_1G264500 [Panicum hallii var. hallii]|uniref:Uncharacterized protein n=1 Tax=Panicum hallii var. hallii TaxID=1504633 RepID=A0A2T7F7R6_9POAL|nr:hypothetical protein GQ55_1G264500 [Panicum hallii var. hallii]